MNRKAQVFAIREVFQFGIGLLVMVGVAFLFSRTIEPQVSTYALNRHVDNINTHVSFLISEIVDLSTNNVMDSNITASFDMPESINEYYYRVYFENDKVCTRYSNIAVSNCVNTTFQNIDLSGQFYSGGELRITCIKKNNSVNISISN